MFKKAPHLKPSTPLKNSDRRRLLSSLQTAYPSLVDAPSEVTAQLVPDGLRSGAAVTSGGEKATIYTDPNARPLWFSLGANAGSAKGREVEVIPTGESPCGLVVACLRLLDGTLTSSGRCAHCHCCSICTLDLSLSATKATNLAPSARSRARRWFRAHGTRSFALTAHVSHLILPATSLPTLPTIHHCLPLSRPARGRARRDGRGRDDPGA